jgi:hypothetical protein
MVKHLQQWLGALEAMAKAASQTRTELGTIMKKKTDEKEKEQYQNAQIVAQRFLQKALNSLSHLKS